MIREDTKIDVDPVKYFAGVKWASENLGVPDQYYDRRYTDGMRWFVRSFKDKERFYFKNEKDAIMFSLAVL